MLRPLTALALVLVGTVSHPWPVWAREPNRPILSGERALRHVKQLVKGGNRAPGTSGHRWAQSYIVRHLRLAYIDEIEEVDFVAQTPRGTKAMKNIIGKIPGKTSEIVVLAGHYDTLQKEGFVGANDGGSSTALLLELARVLGLKQPPPVTVWITFFDGEEAFASWSESDGVYGSRYQVNAWQRAGVLERIKAVIVVDMVGDAELRLRREMNSSPWLTDLIWQIAADKGFADHFSQAQTAVEDDHVPFRRAGVPAVDLIDLEYGPNNRYWHTEHDTVDKLSARSFKVVGEVVLETVARLGHRWPSAPNPSH
jgi:Zn-dependent M28 family amino/carboxypeptidase